MPFCANCGSQVEGRFCAKCGSAVAAGQPAAAPPPPPPPPAGSYNAGPAYQAPAYQAPPAGVGMQDNVASCLCYVLGLITGIVFLVLAPYNQNKTVRFHAFQSIFLNVAWIGLWLVINIFVGMLHFIGLGLLLLISPLIGLAGFVLWIYMMVTAYQGKKVMLPVIGNLAQQQA